MVTSLRRLRLPRPLAVLLAAVLALAFTPLVAATASAATLGNFEIDGNLASDGADDWSSLASGTYTTLLDNTAGTTQDPTTFTSSQEYGTGTNGWPNWQYGGGNAPDKADFGRVAFHKKIVNGKVFLFVGFDRNKPQGTGKFALELNQVLQSDPKDANPVRSQGDVRFVIYDQGSGSITLTPDSKNPDVGFYRWEDPDVAGDQTVPGPPDTNHNGHWVKITPVTATFEGAANTKLVSVPSWWTSSNVTSGQIGIDQFVEFGVDLTSFGAVLDCPSAGYGAINMRSITGTGTTGALVDYIAAQGVTIPSTCGALEISKKGPDGQPLAGAAFKVTPTSTGATPEFTVKDDSDGNTSLDGYSVDDESATPGLVRVSGLKPGSYSVTELAAPAGYVLDPTPVDVSISTGITETGKLATATFTNGLGKVQFAKTDAKGHPLGGAVFEIKGTDGAAAAAPWSIDWKVQDDAVSDAGTNGYDVDDVNDAPGVIAVTGLPTGTYSLSEVVAPTGYALDTAVRSFEVTGTGFATVKPNGMFVDTPKTYPLSVKKLAAGTGDTVQGATFDLYRDNGDGSFGSGDTLVGSATTGGAGIGTVNGLAWGAQYFWVETSAPAPYNLPDVRVVGPVALHADGSTAPAGPATFTDPVSKIVTTATNGALPSAVVSDTATLSGIRSDAGGSITFTLYGPATSPACTTAVWTSGQVPVTGPGSYLSGTVPAGTITKAGSYYWISSYSGDPKTGTRAVAGSCGDAGETSVVAPATPGITTVVPKAEVQLATAPTVLTDTATLSGAVHPTGAISFQLYGPFTSAPAASSCTDAVKAGAAVTAAVSGNGSYDSPGVTVTKAGFYTWVAAYSGDADNSPATHACGLAAETVHVTPAQPVVTTEAAASASALSPEKTYSTDSATLSQATADAKGTITFTLYGPFVSAPNSDSCLQGKAVGALTATVAGNGTYSTPAPGLEITHAGWYTWVASYASSDGNNLDAGHPCGLESETVHVGPATPTVTTTASAPATALSSQPTYLTDSATLAGGTSTVTGELAFTLYGPFPAAPTASSCDGAPVAGTATVPVAGNGTYSSAAPGAKGIEVTAAGWYTWVAAFTPATGDDAPATHACGLPEETVRISPATPAISTSATGAQLPAGTVSDTATVTGLTATAQGYVTFDLYGPSETADCSGTPVYEVSKTLGTVTGGKAVVPSAAYTPTKAGSYYWVAAYGGDGDNTAVAGACGEAGETSVVTRADTSVVTSAVPSATLAPDAVISDTATVSGLTGDATGTVTFTAYGPAASADAVCVTGNAVATRTVDLGKVEGGQATASSGQVKVTKAGLYFWVAGYGGDANNAPSAGACGDEGETSQVDATTPTIVTTATGATLPAGTVTDTAFLSGLTAGAGGSITFRLYGPSADASCDTTPVFTSQPVPVDGNGTYGPVSTTLTGAGSYHWVASYSGDADDAAVAGACGEQGETSVVQPAQPVITTDAGDALRALEGGSLTLTDTATLTGATSKAGGQVSFQLYGPFQSTPDAQSCSLEGAPKAGDPVTVPVAGNGDYTSPGVTVSATGWYTWVATYLPGSDRDNLTATHACALESETVHVVQHALAIVKAVDKDNAARGETLTYTVTVTAGPDVDETGVVVRDPLPAGITYVDASASDGGTAAVSGGVTTLTWDLGTLAEGTSRTVTFQATIDTVEPDPATGAVPGGSIDNVAYATSDAVGEVQDDALTVVPSTVVVGPSGLSVVKTVDKTVAAPGDTLTYGVTATVVRGSGVNGTAVQSAVTLADVVPTGTTYVADSAQCTTTTDPSVEVACDPAYDPATRTVRATAQGDLAVGERLALTFKVRIDDPARGADGKDLTQVTNVALVKSTDVGELPSNEVVTKLVSVQGVIVEKPPTTVVQPATLPHTGADGLLPMAGSGLALLALGLALVGLGWRRRELRVVPRHRRG